MDIQEKKIKTFCLDYQGKINMCVDIPTTTSTSTKLTRPILEKGSDNNIHLQHTGTKFRYIIHGIPKNKKYTIEEAKWSDHTQRFITEQIHTISPQTLKHWLGYIPNTIGAIQTIMWIYFPNIHITDTRSPIEMWEQDKDVFIPYSFDKLRHFPEGSCEEQAAQIPHVK
jgi:hypothetical protein